MIEINGRTLEERAEGKDFSFLLADRFHFLPTEYKVLKGKETAFLPCLMMKRNGDHILYYLTGSAQSMDSMDSILDERQRFGIMMHFLKLILRIRENGFLKPEKILFESSKIFLDPTTLEIQASYLPIMEFPYPSGYHYETVLRSYWIKYINRRKLRSDAFINLRRDLADAGLSLRDLVQKNEGVKSSQNRVAARPAEKSVIGQLIGQGKAQGLRIAITDVPFTIGKFASQPGFQIKGNGSISRTHCRFVKTGEGLMIMDLESSNGTFLNQHRLPPMKAYPVREGDRIRLSDMDFRVKLDR